LYKYDPSKDDGIKLVKNIAYAQNSDYSNFTNDNLRSMNGDIYFVLPDISGEKFHLWRSGGIASNTNIIKSFSGYFNNSSFYVIDSTLYFSEYTSKADFEPWTSDGTTAGTKLLKNISDSGGSFPTYFTECNGNVFFSAYKTGSGRELWLTKGSADNTVRVKDIKKTASESALVYPEYYDTLDSHYLIFTATTPETGTELWKSDGTEAGTVIIKDLYPNEGSSDPIIYEVKNGKAYFGAYDYSTGSEGLFVTDSTNEGTKKLAIVEGNEGPLNGRYLSDVSVADNGIVFFSIYWENLFTNEYGYELWRTDSSGLYYKLPAYPGGFNTAGNTCFFEGSSSSYGYELWVSDGTLQNTHQLIDINPGIDGSYPSHFMSLNNKIIFTAFNGDSTFLYTSDGTIGGTIKIGDMIPSAQYSYMGNSAVFKGKLYFAGFAGSSFGNELCSTDATESGTKLVADINPGSNSSFLSTYPSYFTVADTTLYFIADDGTHGNELWKLSGNTFTANLVKDITLGGKSSDLFDLTPLGETLYFQNDSANIKTPWQTNGSPNSTQIVTDPIFNDSNYENTGFIMGIGNKLFLDATTHQYGDELYVGEPSANKNLYVNNVIAKTISKTKLSARLTNNPFYSDLKINITSPQKQQLIVTITNASGQQISSRAIYANAGINAVTFSSAQWQAGVYIINVSSNAEAISLKAIK
jgi:ELWxxDGT repeat protein